ncbi:Udp-glycosyltransferase 78d2 [Thalictrum thalictroides]|uniref:Glycosyltransferase n=1 Tax=Thalictrum thalictroides TaxID=46969 RepID=A0A7J6V5R6_THATH|nr:Udp-glycosyltransferase 78d2 [Thalictrum thalictroides]
MADIQQSHVAVFAFPFGSHAAPLLNLVKRLAVAAPHITFSFFNTAKSNASIFGTTNEEDGKIDNVNAYNVDDGVPEGYMFTGKPQEDIELFLSVTPNNFKKEIEKIVLETKKKITCLMTDAFLSFAADMAEEMQISWIPLWTSSAVALSVHVYTDLIRDTVGIEPTGLQGEPLNFLPGMPSALRVNDLPVEVFGDNVFSRLLHQMGQTVTRATAITMNSFEDLDPSVIVDLQAKFKQCLPLGPFNLTSPQSSETDPHGCLTWLHDQKPASVAYVSFGTITTLPPNELTALAEALEESKVVFLWSLKDSQKVNLPKGFLDRTSGRGKVVPWAPQSQILGHTATGAFVTHCGWNSVLESITGGAPMICRPGFGDQNLNAQLVSNVWGIGVVVKDGKLSKDGVMNALDLVLHKDDGKKMRGKVLVLKELAKQAVGPKGSSTKNFQALLRLVSMS